MPCYAMGMSATETKLRRLETLRDKTSSEGERAACQAAIERLKSKAAPKNESALSMLRRVEQHLRATRSFRKLDLHLKDWAMRILTQERDDGSLAPLLHLIRRYSND